MEQIRNNNYYQSPKPMQNPVRHRKAFYQKQNDYKNGNKKIDLYKSFDHKYLKTQLQEYSSSHVTKPTSYPQRKLPKNDSEAYCSQYTTEILNNSHNSQIPSRFLERHKIDSGLRARMLDWMVEVITSYKFSSKTYFAAVQIMDRYFERQSQCLEPSKLHIIGVVSIMIATKMEQVYPLKLKTVYEKIAHRKISENEITSFEARISYILDFKLNSWTFFDLSIAKLHILIQTLNSNHRGILSTFNQNYCPQYNYQTATVKQIQDKKSQIQEIMDYLSRFLIFDYDMYHSGSMNLFSDVILKLAFEIVKIPCQLGNVFTSQQIDVELCKEQLKSKIIQFESRFSGINNIKKFTRPQIVKLVDREIFYQ